MDAQIGDITKKSLTNLDKRNKKNHTHTHRQGEIEMARKEPGTQIPLRLLTHLSFYEPGGMKR